MTYHRTSKFSEHPDHGLQACVPLLILNFDGADKSEATFQQLSLQPKMNSNLPIASSSDDASSEEGDTFDASASSLTFLVEDSKRPGGKWVHPGPHTPTKLRFADYAEVQFTTGLHEYSPEEIERCWMNSLDETDAQGEIVDTVRHMRKPPEDWWRWFSSQDGNIADGTKKTIEEQEEDFSRYLEEELGLCTRGIEHMKSKSAREQRQLRRKFIAQVVLEEQEVRHAVL